jgi:hypothetical protein
MCDQADLWSVSQKALEHVSDMMGDIPTLPFERAFATHRRRPFVGRQSQLKSTTVDTRRRNLDKHQH